MVKPFFRLLIPPGVRGNLRRKLEQMIRRQTVTLSLSAKLTDEDVEDVIKVLKQILVCE